MTTTDNQQTVPKRATREELQELHYRLTKLFLTALRNPSKYDLSANFLNVVRQFLRDNSIVKDLAFAKDIKDGLKALGDADLPFLPTLN